MISVNSDAAKAVTTVAAQRIAAYADRNHIPIDQTQCEEIAEHLISLYQAFFTGLTHRAQQIDTPPTS